MAGKLSAAALGFAIAAVLTWHLLPTHRAAQVSATAPKRSSATTVAKAAARSSVAAALRHEQTLPGAGRRTVASLTAWQRMVLHDDKALATQSFVRHAVNESLGARGLHPADCMTNANLIGDFALQFVSDVVSEPNVVHVGRWHLNQVVDGSPLPDDVVACMEEMLPPPTDIAAPTPGMFMSSYEGPMTIDFAMDLEPAPGVPAP